MHDAKEPNHTPGPWRYWESWDAEGAYDVLTGNFGGKGPRNRIALVPESDGLNKDANARLIAAAPILLAALRAVVADACQGCGDWERGFDCRPPECLNACGNLREAREAVCEATGESHA